MLIRLEVLEGIVAGKITLQFRRQKRPTVKKGGRLRTRVGELAIHDVKVVSERAITKADAIRAGYSSKAELMADLAAKDGAAIYRIELGFGGEDPRIALRNSGRINAREVAEIDARLERYDGASRRGPWTREALDLIAEHEARRAPELAEIAGHETKWWKANIRKLKELGLTESLAVGYQLSPRGRAYRKKSRR